MTPIKEPIKRGNITLIGHVKGGWALPGGGRTERRFIAESIAEELDKLVSKKASNHG